MLHNNPTRSRPRRRRLVTVRRIGAAGGVRTALACLPFLFGCGDGGTGFSSTPAAPTTSPTAPPSSTTPPPPAPGVRGVTITTSPSNARGYVAGETIAVEINFSEAVTVSGSPRLALEIGARIRHASWDPEPSTGPILAFRYEVTVGDRDADGITVGADALDLNGGAIRNANGVAADVNIGPHALAQDAGHRVLGVPPPTVQRLVVTTSPFDPRGYVVGEAIGIQVTFSEPVMVSGSPLLKLGLGEELVEAGWDEEASSGALVAFRYVVTLDDRDEDGISIGAGALDADDGTIQSGIGVGADLDIGDHAIADDGDHPVLGAPPDWACEDQRRLALGHDAQWTKSGLVSQWDGTPFRVDMIRNFPDFVTDADLRRLLAPVDRLADQIESQLGYRIVEMGDLVDVPDGAPPGWDQDFRRYFRERRLIAEPGQILVFYLNDDNDTGEGSLMVAHPCCGTISYNKGSLGPFWTGDDPCCRASTYEAEAIVHEVFHLLGFKHAVDQEHLVGVRMSRGALDLPWESGSSSFYAAWTDIENLRCIFPEGG